MCNKQTGFEVFASLREIIQKTLTYIVSQLLILYLFDPRESRNSKYLIIHIIILVRGSTSDLYILIENTDPVSPLFSRSSD